jgi:hypothetical protein
MKIDFTPLQKKWLANVKSKSRNIILTTPRSGKTLFCNAICAELLKKDPKGRVGFFCHPLMEKLNKNHIEKIAGRPVPEDFLVFNPSEQELKKFFNFIIVDDVLAPFNLLNKTGYHDFLIFATLITASQELSDWILTNSNLPVASGRLSIKEPLKNWPRFFMGDNTTVAHLHRYPQKRGVLEKKLGKKSYNTIYLCKLLHEFS